MQPCCCVADTCKWMFPKKISWIICITACEFDVKYDLINIRLTSRCIVELTIWILVADIEHMFELLDLLELWNLVLNSFRILRSAELSGVLDDSHMTPARKIPPGLQFLLVQQHVCYVKGRNKQRKSRELSNPKLKSPNVNFLPHILSGVSPGILRAHLLQICHMCVS